MEGWQVRWWWKKCIKTSNDHKGPSVQLVVMRMKENISISTKNIFAYTTGAEASGGSSGSNVSSGSHTSSLPSFPGGSPAVVGAASGSPSLSAGHLMTHQTIQVWCNNDDLLFPNPLLHCMHCYTSYMF